MAYKDNSISFVESETCFKSKLPFNTISLSFLTKTGLTFNVPSVPIHSKSLPGFKVVYLLTSILSVDSHLPLVIVPTFVKLDSLITEPKTPKSLLLSAFKVIVNTGLLSILYDLSLGIFQFSLEFQLLVSFFHTIVLFVEPPCNVIPPP